MNQWNEQLTESDYDTELDKLIDTQILRWYPWIGKNYNTQDRKVLIVGENYYLSRHLEEKGVHLTRFTMWQQGIADDSDSNFCRNIRLALAGNKSKRESFWENVALLNFVQTPMETNVSRPTAKDCQNGLNAFDSVIEILQPTDIVFFGLETARSLSNGRFDKKFCDKISGVAPMVITYKDRPDINIVAVRHPSAYFSWSKWRNFINRNISVWRNISPSKYN